MKLTGRILGNAYAYRLWQAPFAERKFAPVLAHNDLRRVRRVLDVGCGPGTNTQHFADAYYLGIDHNSSYIEYARQRYQREFLVADIAQGAVAATERFDFILLNSFLHHTDTPRARRILSHLASLLTDDGCVHILDLVLPNRLCFARILARLDRGGFPRRLQEWRELFGEVFVPVVFKPFELTSLGVHLWEMVYFKGSAKR